MARQPLFQTRKPIDRIRRVKRGGGKESRGGEIERVGCCSGVRPRGGRRVVSEGADRAAVTGGKFQGKGSEEDAGLRELIEVGETLDDRDAAAEQNAVDARDLREVVNVGDRGRLNSENLDAVGDTPVGEVIADAGQAVAVDGGIGDVFVPVGAEQEAFAVGEGGGEGAEVSNGEQ
jgi:hypothetical protein